MIESLTASGFRVASAEDALVLANVRPCINEFSAFARVDAVQPLHPDALVVDSYYGQIYDVLPEGTHALYGATDDLPAYGIDRLSNHGFLRVPFRRIPRCVVRSVEELVAALAPISLAFAKRGQTLHYRGQTREYSLPRQPDTLAWLYGDRGVIEPSLLPSAARAGFDVNEIAPLWNGLTARFLAEATERAREAGDVETERALRDDEILLGTTYRYYLFSTALAQHYGLPTTGLDLTTSLATALYFAFTRFVAGPDHTERTHRPAPGDALPVLYVLAPPAPNTSEYGSYGPRALGIDRPRAQTAHFLHTGWGDSSNDAARRILLAFYLDFDARGDARIPSSAALFPTAEEDTFGNYLDEVRSHSLPASLARYLDRFRWVYDEEPPPARASPPTAARP